MLSFIIRSPPASRMKSAPVKRGTSSTNWRFEIAALVGVALGAASRRIAVVVDGFIATSAAMLAVQLCPRVQGYLIAAHRSAEFGHGVALEALELEPLVALDLRLGEGSGAAVVLRLLDAAVALLSEMATFEEAGVAAAREPVSMN